MSANAWADVTLAVGDVEQDVEVRACVTLEREHGAWVAFIVGGHIEACVDGAWVALHELDVSARDIDRADEALCDAAFEGRVAA